VDSRPLLLRLRLRGKITDATATDVADLVAAGHATTRGDAVVLSPSGRAAADARFRIGDPDADAVRAAYDQFLTRNAELIRICHDWQQSPGNWKVVDRLATVDDRTGPVIRRLGTRVEEFAGYRPRLRSARGRVEEGAGEWLTSPHLDSYHTVWMELHEHLLVALALDRAAEGAENPS